MLWKFVLWRLNNENCCLDNSTKQTLNVYVNYFTNNRHPWLWIDGKNICIASHDTWQEWRIDRLLLIFVWIIIDTILLSTIELTNYYWFLHKSSLTLFYYLLLTTYQLIIVKFLIILLSLDLFVQKRLVL